MNKLKRLKIFGFLLIVMALFALGLCAYGTSLVANMQDGACDTLNELTQQQVFNINLKLEMDVNTIKSMAQALSGMDKDKLSDVAFLKSIQQNTSFAHVAFIDTNGVGHNSNGQRLDVADRDFFKKALSGQTIVSTPVVSRLDDATTIIPMATPINLNGKVIGVLVGIYGTDSVSSMILPSYGGEGFAYITDSAGKIIIPPKSKNSIFSNKYGYKNMFDGFAACKFISNDNLETIKVNLEFGLSGHSIVEIDGLKRYSHYSPLGFNGWYLFMMVPENAIMRQAQSVIQNTVTLAVGVLLVITAFLFLIVYLQQRSEKERTKYTVQLERIAYFDDITNAPTLYYFKELAIKALMAKPMCRVSLIRLDIVNFKLINDIYGFDVGNDVLRAVKDSIDELAKGLNCSEIFCTRINADEFVVFDAYDGSAANGAERWAIFLQSVNQKVSKILKHWHLEFYIGRYFFDTDEYDIVKALEKVNLAYRTAKKKGLNGFCDYDTSLRDVFIEKIDIENKMHSALKNKEFKLYLQPKYKLKDETVAGAEALVRWKRRDGEIIPPNKFIHIFEGNGFITQLDFYMYEAVCRLINLWQQEGKKAVPVSVNFSRLHLSNPDFVSQLVDIANKYKIDRRLLEIELTESVFFDNADVIERLLCDLRQEGFTLSIDDFGTGYSSLGLLKDLPIDVIKIDQSFFTNNKYNERAKAVIESVVQMARRLNIFTVAEGVETEEHVRLLREVGCDLVQGYYYAKPAQAEDFVLDYV